MEHYTWRLLTPQSDSDPTYQEMKPTDSSMRPEPRAAGAKTKRQQGQNANSRSDKRQSNQLLTAFLPADLNRLNTVQQ